MNLLNFCVHSVTKVTVSALLLFWGAHSAWGLVFCASSEILQNKLSLRLLRKQISFLNPENKLFS